MIEQQSPADSLFGRIRYVGDDSNKPCIRNMTFETYLSAIESFPFGGIRWRHRI